MHFSSLVQPENDDLFVCFLRIFSLTGCPWRSQSCSQYYHLHFGGKVLHLHFHCFSPTHFSLPACISLFLVPYTPFYTWTIIRSHADSHFLPGAGKVSVPKFWEKSLMPEFPEPSTSPPSLRRSYSTQYRIWCLLYWIFALLLSKKFFQVFSNLMIAEHIDKNIWYVIQPDRCSPQSYCHSGATKVHVHYIWNGNE